MVYICQDIKDIIFSYFRKNNLDGLINITDININNNVNCHFDPFNILLKESSIFRLKKNINFYLNIDNIDEEIYYNINCNYHEFILDFFKNYNDNINLHDVDMGF